MKNLLIPILFALGTALFWGSYGPAIGKAQSIPKTGPDSWSGFKPYVFIGLAYVVIAVIGGLLAMKVKGDTFSYSGSHSPARDWGFLAGCLGALGALCLTNAMAVSKGNSALVMPIVFGGAVAVNGLISYLKFKGQAEINPGIWAGMGLIFVGVILVAMLTPHGPKKPSKAAAEAPVTESVDPA